MKNLPLLIATLVGSLIFVFGIAFLFSRGDTSIADATELTAGARHIATNVNDGAASEATPSATPNATPVPNEANEATESAEPTPEPTTKVTIVEFSDFQYPACRAASSLKSQLLTQYPGQVEFIYRHFPLVTIHANAQLAAQAAEAASKFDKFWEMHDVLFEKQDEWASLDADKAEETFVSYAESLEIPKEGFANELKNDTVKSAVQTDVSLANRLRVNSTPTFYVNGQKVSASEVFSAVEQALQQ